MASTSNGSGIRTLDPTLSVALSLHATKGGYALLLGSGVSRAAGIPTGWEVVQDLAHRLAKLEGGDAAQDAESDAFKWYRDTYGVEASYSELLGHLARTPAERRELLRRYFEPTEDEREQGVKMPTRAHRAIARLVARGVVRVILTTNFDQLLESALREQGVTPAVISGPDGVKGMLPLHLAPATLIKLHGDYLDTRIRNTSLELASYSAPVTRLLSRVLDEYGLIVAGWSAGWDDALRAAIMACPTRRFTTYWATRGSVIEEARRLIDVRQARVIKVKGADEFFEALDEKVTTLDQLDQPHPLSTTVAIATLKRYLPVAEYRIRVDDLLTEEVERVIGQVRKLMPTAQPATNKDIVDVLPRIEAAATTTTALMATAGFWAEGVHQSTLVGAIERLANASPSIESRTALVHHWENLYHFPAQLAWYAAGMGALAQGSPGEDKLADLLLRPQTRSGLNREITPAYYALSNCDIVEGEIQKAIPGFEKHHTPFSDYLFERLREPMRQVLPDDARYEACFERFEYLVALLYANRRRTTGGSTWAPVGRLAWRRRNASKGTVIEQVAAETSAQGANWFLIRRGAFDGSPEVLKEVQALVLEVMGFVRY